MGKKGGGTPDYKGAAEATAASDKEMLEAQTKANRPNQNNPWGNIRWTQDEDGNWTQDTTLNKDLQDSLDAELGLQKGRTELAGGMLGRMEGEFGQPIDWSKYGDQTQLGFDKNDPKYAHNANDPKYAHDPNDPKYAFDQGKYDIDINANRQAAEDAAYGRATSRLDPRFEESDNALEVSLRQRGLSEGDAAFDSAMKNQAQTKNDAYATARQDAVGQGRAEAQQAFQQNMQMSEQDFAQKMGMSKQDYAQKMGMSQQDYQQAMGKQGQDFDQAVGSADYANKLRQQAMTEEMQRRGFSLNEINAIISGQQVNSPSFDGFNQAGKGQGTDYSGALRDQSNFDQMQNQGFWSGLGGLANAGMGFMCDRRLKRDIERIGTFMGFPFYTFTYLWGEKAAGVMADEVNPEAVFTHSSGFNAVDISKLDSGAA